MTGANEQEAQPTAADRAAARRREREAARRRAAVFGDVLPEGTSDERPDGWGDQAGGTSDDWLRGQVPPHHG